MSDTKKKYFLWGCAASAIWRDAQHHAHPNPEAKQAKHTPAAYTAKLRLHITGRDLSISNKSATTRLCCGALLDLYITLKD